MDLDDLEKRIDQNTKKLDKLTQLIEHNAGKIDKNSEKIENNSGALALLHTIKSNGDKYFIIWIITFMAFLCSIGYIIFLKGDIGSYEDNETIEIEDVESIDNTHIKIGDDIWEKSE